MTDNQILHMVLNQLGAVAEKVDAIRDTTQDTRERVIRLEEQRASTVERLTRVEHDAAELAADLATVQGEVGGASKRASMWATAISSVAGALSVMWGKG